MYPYIHYNYKLYIHFNLFLEYCQKKYDTSFDKLKRDLTSKCGEERHRLKTVAT